MKRVYIVVEGQTEQEFVNSFGQVGQVGEEW